jgi:hypothetical protein
MSVPPTSNNTAANFPDSDTARLRGLPFYALPERHLLRYTDPVTVTTEFSAFPPSLALARAFVAFQLAAHWGNRHTPRPGPRADVLAAMLWERALGAGDGAPGGRYVEYLALSLALGRVRDTGLASGVRSSFLTRAEVLRTELAGEPVYGPLLASAAHRANLAILHLCDTLAATLVTARERTLKLPGLPRANGEEELEARLVAGQTFRVHPWPFVGRRLAVHAELPGTPDGLQARRVYWTLLTTAAFPD